MTVTKAEKHHTWLLCRCELVLSDKRPLIEGFIISNTEPIFAGDECYDTSFPREIWEGYITKVTGYNDADYYFWSLQKLKKILQFLDGSYLVL